MRVQRKRFGAEKDYGMSGRSKREVCAKLRRSLRCKTVLSGGALVLQEIDGEVFPQPINSDSVKKFHA